VDVKGNRRIIGKIWLHGEDIPAANNFIANEVDPERKTLIGLTTELFQNDTISDIYGNYAVRTSGLFAKDINHFIVSPSGLVINNRKAESFSYTKGKLSWSGGNKECYSGSVTLIVDPIIKTIELFGYSACKGDDRTVKCYGSSVYHDIPDYCGPKLPAWAEKHLTSIAFDNSKRGGLLLWHKWEKHHFTSRFLNKTISGLA